MMMHASGIRPIGPEFTACLCLCVYVCKHLGCAIVCVLSLSMCRTVFVESLQHSFIRWPKCHYMHNIATRATTKPPTTQRSSSTSSSNAHIIIVPSSWCVDFVCTHLCLCWWCNCFVWECWNYWKIVLLSRQQQQPLRSRCACGSSCYGISDFPQCHLCVLWSQEPSARHYRVNTNGMACGSTERTHVECICGAVVVVLFLLFIYTHRTCAKYIILYTHIHMFANVRAYQTGYIYYARCCRRRRVGQQTHFTRQRKQRALCLYLRLPCLLFRKATPM